MASHDTSMKKDSTTLSFVHPFDDGSNIKTVLSPPLARTSFRLSQPTPTTHNLTLPSHSADDEIEAMDGGLHPRRFSLADYVFPRRFRRGPSDASETTVSTMTAITEKSFPAETQPRSGFLPLSATTSAKQPDTAAVPVTEVRLDDMLRCRLAPPHSASDFEEYLVHKALASELLYFVVWLDSYTVLYEACLPQDRTAALLAALRVSYEHAMATFFADSTFELNLSGVSRREIMNAAAVLSHSLSITPAAEPFLPPSVFTAAHTEVRQLLDDAFRSFINDIQSVRSQAGRPWATWSFGISLLSLGLLPTIVAIVLNGHRGFRAIGIPFIFMGCVFLLSAPRKLCPVLYVLKAHVVPAPPILQPQAAAKPSTCRSTASKSVSLELYPTFTESKKHDFSSPMLRQLRYYPLPVPVISPSSGADLNSTQRQSFIISKPLSPTTKRFTALSTAEESSPIAGGSRGWLRSTTSHAKARPWAIEASRETMIYASKWGLLLTLIVTAILMSVPNR